MAWQASPRVVILLQAAAWAFYNQGDLDRLPTAYRPANFAVTIFKIGVNIEHLAACAAAAGQPPSGAPPLRCILARMRTFMSLLEVWQESGRSSRRTTAPAPAVTSEFSICVLLEIKAYLT